MMRATFRGAAAAFAVCLALSGRPGAAEQTRPIEHFVAKAPAGRIDIFIEHWSLDEVRERLRTTLIQRGPDMLLGVVQSVKRRAGFVLFPGQQGLGARARMRRGQNLQFAREINAKTGRQVIIATDQRPGFDESTRATRSPESEFTLIDIRIGPDGKGVGKLGIASGVTYNTETQTFELEHYGTRPVVLSEVRSEKP